MTQDIEGLQSHEIPEKMRGFRFPEEIPETVAEEALFDPRHIEGADLIPLLRELFNPKDPQYWERFSDQLKSYGELAQRQIESVDSLKRQRHDEIIQSLIQVRSLAPSLTPEQKATLDYLIKSRSDLETVILEWLGTADPMRRTDPEKYARLTDTARMRRATKYQF